MNKRRTRKNNRLSLIVIILLILSVSAVVVHANGARAEAYEYSDVGMYYVEEGDTLWKIAQLHSNNSHDIRKVIDIMQDIDPTLTATIYPGQAVDVPLFNNMDWDYYQE